MILTQALSLRQITSPSQSLPAALRMEMEQMACGIIEDLWDNGRCPNPWRALRPGWQESFRRACAQQNSELGCFSSPGS